MGSPDAPPEAPLAVRRAALNFVPANSVVNLFAWMLAWVIFGLLNPLVNGEPLDNLLNDFLGIAGVGGIFTTAIVHFLLELVWRPALRRYFPDGRLSATPAFRLPVLGRLLVFFLLVGILPAGLLVLVSLTRAHAILDAPNPHLIYDNLLIIEVFIVSVTALSSIGIAIFVSRTIVEPLRALQNAMARVEQNDLAARSAVTTNDELGYLSERFNEMVGGLQRAGLMRNLLNLYISPQVAQALEHAPTWAAAWWSAACCSRICDFTGLAERLPPAELIALLNRYLRHDRRHRRARRLRQQVWRRLAAGRLRHPTQPGRRPRR
jgi:HAMP domain-containing protein